MVGRRIEICVGQARGVFDSQEDEGKMVKALALMTRIDRCGIGWALNGATGIRSDDFGYACWIPAPTISRITTVVKDKTVGNIRLRS
jgi:hypothetical protein